MSSARCQVVETMRYHVPHRSIPATLGVLRRYMSLTSRSFYALDSITCNPIPLVLITNSFLERALLTREEKTVVLDLWMVSSRLSHEHFTLFCTRFKSCGNMDAVSCNVKAICQRIPAYKGCASTHAKTRLNARSLDH